MFRKKTFLEDFSRDVLAEGQPFSHVMYDSGRDILTVLVLGRPAQPHGPRIIEDRIHLFIDYGFYTGSRSYSDPRLGLESPYAGLFDGDPDDPTEISEYPEIADYTEIAEREPWYLHEILEHCDNNCEYPCHIRFIFRETPWNGKRVKWLPAKSSRRKSA